MSAYNKSNNFIFQFCSGALSLALRKLKNYFIVNDYLPVPCSCFVVFFQTKKELKTENYAAPMRKFNYTFLTIHNHNNLFNLNIKWEMCIARSRLLEGKCIVFGRNQLITAEADASKREILPKSARFIECNCARVSLCVSIDLIVFVYRSLSLSLRPHRYVSYSELFETWLCHGVKYNLFTITINRIQFYERKARIHLNGVS